MPPWAQAKPRSSRAPLLLSADDYSLKNELNLVLLACSSSVATRGTAHVRAHRLTSAPARFPIDSTPSADGSPCAVLRLKESPPTFILFKAGEESIRIHDLRLSTPFVENTRAPRLLSDCCVLVGSLRRVSQGSIDATRAIPVAVTPQRGKRAKVPRS